MYVALIPGLLDDSSDYDTTLSVDSFTIPENYNIRPGSIMPGSYPPNSEDIPLSTQDQLDHDQLRLSFSSVSDTGAPVEQAPIGDTIGT